MKVTMDAAAIAARHRQTGQSALAQWAGEVRDEANRYAPVQSGALVRSAQAQVLEDGRARVVWQAPYAGNLYRGKTADGRALRISTARNSLARSGWFEAAKRDAGAWRERLAGLLGGRTW